MDGMLSQEEINALLSGADIGMTESKSSNNSELSDLEKDTMGEISNISMGTAATTLSSLVNQKVDITTPQVSFSNWQDLVDSYDKPCVCLQIGYKEGLDGKNVLILKEIDVKIIADLMMGGDGTNVSDSELGELQLSAISEAMNQMMGTAATSMSSMLSMKIDISPPVASLVDLNDVGGEMEIDEFLREEFLRIAFRMTIGDLVDSEIMQLYPVEFAKTLCNKFGVGDDYQAPVTQEADTKATSAPPQPVQQPPVQQMQQMPDMGQQPMGQQMSMPMQQMPMMGMPMQQMPMMGMQGQQMPMMNMPMQNVNVQQAQFQAFSPDIVAVNQRENINLIMDVPLEVTVELGRTSKSIQDILEFAPGTIIELNKIAGEPIDVLVNGKYVAKGEVVVIEESYGVRVTEIIK